MDELDDSLKVQETNENYTDLNESLIILNEFYRRALLYEFDLNQRNEEFLIQFQDVSIFFVIIHKCRGLIEKIE